MNIYVNNNWQRIGISLSGGADSALLSYLVLEKTNADIYFTTQVRMWKTRPWQRFIAKDVVKWFKSRFKNNIEHIEGFVPPEMEEPHTTYIKDEYGKLKPGNRIILRSHNEWVAHTYNLDAWFSGVTKNPKDVPGGLRDRDNGDLPIYLKHMNVEVFHPFVYTTKECIIEQYYKNDIKDLLDITRSCEGEFENINYQTYIPGQYVPLCNSCWWCKEREWAIDQIK